MSQCLFSRASNDMWFIPLALSWAVFGSDKFQNLHLHYSQATSHNFHMHIFCWALISYFALTHLMLHLSPWSTPLYLQCPDPLDSGPSVLLPTPSFGRFWFPPSTMSAQSILENPPPNLTEKQRKRLMLKPTMRRWNCQYPLLIPLLLPLQYWIIDLCYGPICR